MSRTKYAAELCALMVEDLYGELSSRVVTLLLRRGRLSISSLEQHTNLSLMQLRHGLAVLIQQNLVYHHFDRDARVTFYEAHQDAIYFLLRFGKIIEAVRSRYGDLAGNIIQILLVSGSSRIGDLADKFEAKQPKGSTGPNGYGHENENENDFRNQKVNGNTGVAETPLRSRFDDILCQLSESGFIERVVGDMFLSPADTYNKVENELLHELYKGATKGTKEKEQLRVSIRERLGEIRSKRENGLKRATIEALVNGDAKKQKLANGTSILNGKTHLHRSVSLRLDHNIIIRVNYEKCNVALRNERLVSVASHDIGPTTAQVYGDLLRQLEAKTPRCQINPNIDESDASADGPSITTLNLMQVLSRDVIISAGIGRAGSSHLDTTHLEKLQQKATNLSKKRSFDGSDVSIEGDSSLVEAESDADGDNVGEIVEVEYHCDGPGEDGPVSATSGKAPSRQAKVTFQTNPMLQEDRHNRMIQTNKHLLLLAEHSSSLVLRCGSGGGGEWMVDYASAIKYLKETQIDTFVCQSFGDKGRRISRILREKGKLDEKQIQKFGLLKQKDVRTKLIEMQMAGFVDIQEVPRDNNRTPSRTIFLWYFDTERVTAILLDRVYKTMSRHLQVLKSEKDGAQLILSLAERTDVRGNEEEAFSEQQITDWSAIKLTEARILTQLSRLDEVVAIFRDF